MSRDGGLLSELLYASDLVLMAPTMEQPGIRVADWRVSLLNKGLNVNSGRFKVMEGNGGGSLQFLVLGELPFPQHAAGVVGTLNCCAFLYHSGILSTVLLFIFGP